MGGRLKTWGEIGIDIPEFVTTVASPIGYIMPDELIPFLIAFRKIIEAQNLNHESRIAVLLALSHNAAHGPYWRRFCQAYDDLPYSFFYFPLTELPGVGRKTAKGLYAAGIRTREDIVAATVERLSKVPGIGNARAGKLQAFSRL